MFVSFEAKKSYLKNLRLNFVFLFKQSKCNGSEFVELSLLFA